MMINSDLYCCGLREINGLAGYRDPKKALVDVLDQFREIECSREWPYTRTRRGDPNLHFAQIIFSQAGTKATYGKKFKKFLEEEGLGSVVESAPQCNPNSGRNVIAFIWTPDKKKVIKWWREYEKSSVTKT